VAVPPTSTEPKSMHGALAVTTVPRAVPWAESRTLLPPRVASSKVSIDWVPADTGVKVISSTMCSPGATVPLAGATRKTGLAAVLSAQLDS